MGHRAGGAEIPCTCPRGGAARSVKRRDDAGYFHYSHSGKIIIAIDYSKG